MAELSLTNSTLPKLSTEEMLELERIYKDMGEKTLDKNFCQEIAKSFSAGKTSISWEQVQQWFQNTHRESQDQDTSAGTLNQPVDLSFARILKNRYKSFTISKGKVVEDVSDLVFEARSMKDFAWHDVAKFRDYRNLSTGELMLELERTYKDMGEKTLDKNFCQEIAKIFSAGKTSISWEQVQQWFQNKHRESQDQDTSAGTLNQLVDLSDAPILKNGYKSFKIPKGKGDEDLSDLAFEARSMKDFAWHDVAMLLNYRNLSTGELEVRVRYAGFGKDDDEWVNVKKRVRERSIPLEASECHKVKDGDLVLCFLERDDYALYCDARIVRIQRSRHDATDCKCIFTVRFLHDKSEEAIPWTRICCRPTQEESVVNHESPKPAIEQPSLSAIENLWG